MTLTAQQRKAADEGGAVAVFDSGNEYIVLSRETYERMKSLDYDDGEWTDDEMLALAVQTFEDADNAELIVRGSI